MNNYARSSLFTSCLTTLLLGYGVAEAQPEQQPPEQQQQPQPEAQQQQPAPAEHRITAGAAMGAGMLSSASSASSQQSALSLAIYFGVKLTPTFTLGLETHALHFSPDAMSNPDISVRLTSLTAQTWLTPKVSLKGGLGIGTASASKGDSSISAELGMGGIAAVGVTLAENALLALQLQFRVAAISTDKDIGLISSIGLGVHWR